MPHEEKRFEYEYAGFKYIMIEEGGRINYAEALPHQHPAAYKDRHRRSAIEQAQEDLDRCRRRQRKKEEAQDGTAG